MQHLLAQQYTPGYSYSVVITHVEELTLLWGCLFDENSRFSTSWEVNYPKLIQSFKWILIFSVPVPEVQFPLHTIHRCPYSTDFPGECNSDKVDSPKSSFNDLERFLLFCNIGSYCHDKCIQILIRLTFITMTRESMKT